MSQRATLIASVVLGTIVIAALAYRFTPVREDDKDE